MALNVQVSIDGTHTTFESGADSLMSDLHVLFTTASVSNDIAARIMRAITAARGQSVTCEEAGVSVSITVPPAPARPVSGAAGSPGGWGGGVFGTNGGAGWGG